MTVALSFPRTECITAIFLSFSFQDRFIFFLPLPPLSFLSFPSPFDLEEEKILTVFISVRPSNSIVWCLLDTNNSAVLSALALNLKRLSNPYSIAVRGRVKWPNKSLMTYNVIHVGTSPCKPSAMYRLL